MNNKQNHQTTHIKYGALEADIDIEIAPLILELWKGDMYTIASCQSNADNDIWIKFENPNAAALFLATALCAGTLTANVTGQVSDITNHKITVLQSLNDEANSFFRNFTLEYL